MSADNHAQRMATKKAAMDAAIARASTERGVIVVLTGPGKGKSSSAFGMVARALGHGLRVAVVQFIKSRADTGEAAFFAGFPGIEWYVSGEGFTWETQDAARDAAAAARGWDLARGALGDPAVHLVVLDEITYLLNRGHIALDDALEVLRARPAHQHVVITGRGASPALIEAADTVSYIENVRHAFQAGVKAQRGVDL